MADEEKLWRFGEQITPGGYLIGEVSSALQKDIRRGNEEGAVFWATELDLAGYGNYAFKRLRIICSEDVGLAWTEGPAVIRALYEEFTEFKKAEKGEKTGNSMLYLVHATILLARAPKSRIIDNACCLYYGMRDTVVREVPDYAVDGHTDRGRKLGRKEENTYDESYGLANQVLPDPYVEQAHPWMSDEQMRRHAEPHVDYPDEAR
jgi:replication-associated recombination protein RarA